MEKPNKIGAQIYGYTVCLVAVIVFILSTIGLVEAIIDRSDPFHAGITRSGEPSLASYENYKMDILRSLPKEDGASKTSYVPDEATLKTMYETSRAEKTDSSLRQANRSLIINSITLLISITLFVTHWRWMRKITQSES